MKSVFLIKTPLQLLNAIEARHYFNLRADDCILIIMGDRKSQPQILMLADAVDEWGKVITLNNVDLFGEDIYKSNNFYFLRKIQQLNFFKKSFFNVRRLNKISHQLGEVKYVFIGYARYIYMKHFINITLHEKVLLLDDGNATILLAKERQQGGASLANGLMKTLKLYGKRYFQGVRDDEQKNISFFTIYDISPGGNDEVFKNNFNYLRSGVDSLPVRDEVYFIGSPIGETGILSPESYLTHMKKVKEYFANKNIIYIAHRRESEESLNKIKTELGLKVILFDYPIEYQLAFIGPRPKVLASFISSALDSCRLIFGDKLKIMSFKLNLVDSPKQEIIEQIYESYKPYITKDFSVVADY